MKNIKLAKIVEDYALTQERPAVDKFQVIEAIKSYARVGKQLYDKGGIIEASKQLAQMAEAAQNHVLSETDDWFDGVSVKRNMKELKGLTGQFKKTAVEANSVNQRLSALYEDIQRTRSCWKPGETPFPGELVLLQSLQSALGTRSRSLSAAGIFRELSEVCAPFAGHNHSDIGSSGLLLSDRPAGVGAGGGA